MGGVNPPIKEVVVAIWKALHRQEEVYSFLVVPFGSGFLAERDVSNMETCILRLFDPLGPWSSLDVGSWPVPSIL